jgi:sulfatase maturation enzyme AslB (radical SAM superfamily)
MSDTAAPPRIARFPGRVVLELTPLCNLACRMCPRHYIKDTDGFMAPELFRKLVDEVAQERPDAVLLPFWRGESCMHPQFAELVDYALTKNLRVHLSTNGHYLSPENCDVFYRCEFLTFSLHSKVGFQNAQKFIDAKPDWSKVTTQISFVDSEKTTQRYFPKYIGDAKLKGFDGIRLYVEHTLGGEFGKNATKAAAPRTFCPKLEESFVVAADGSYSRCNHIWTPETTHNLATATIAQVWSSERMQRIRTTYPDEKCAPCDQWTGHTNGEAWRKKPDGAIQHIVFSPSIQPARDESDLLL